LIPAPLSSGPLRLTSRLLTPDLFVTPGAIVRLSCPVPPLILRFLPFSPAALIVCIYRFPPLSLGGAAVISARSPCDPSQTLPYSPRRAPMRFLFGVSSANPPQNAHFPIASLPCAEVVLCIPMIDPPRSLTRVTYGLPFSPHMPWGDVLSSLFFLLAVFPHRWTSGYAQLPLSFFDPAFSSFHWT